MSLASNEEKTKTWVLKSSMFIIPEKRLLNYKLNYHLIVYKIYPQFKLCATLPGTCLVTCVGVRDGCILNEPFQVLWNNFHSALYLSLLNSRQVCGPLDTKAANFWQGCDPPCHKVVTRLWWALWDNKKAKCPSCVHVN